RKFCSECATRLAVVSPACGTLNSPTAKFCGECATALNPDAATTSGVRTSLAPAVTAVERRLVSVLFLDLVSFAIFAEGRDAEETRDLLSSYFDLARDVIARY